ncbi:MAG: DUF1456 family protein [Bacteriovoracaceae bacterium]
MINNDVLRSVRYMLKVNESKLIDIVKLAGGDVLLPDMISYLKREDEEGFKACPQEVMSHFLDGLIIFKRGKDENRPPPPFELPTNNVVLKKLRVAFELKDDDIVVFMEKSGLKVSKTEISALFRKFGHVNYRECGDQFLRQFLKGLTSRVRPD